VNSKEKPMPDTERAPEFPADEPGSDDLLSPEARAAVQENCAAVDADLDDEERVTAEVEEADDEPEEPDELEPDARPDVPATA
jgi:hypothetical protein